MDHLTNLPVELVLYVLRHLSTLERHFLSLASRYFHDVVGMVRLNRQDTFTVRLQREQSNPDRYLRLCSNCLRLRQFYHYSLNQASASKKPERRLCLDCFLSAHDPLNYNQFMAWIMGTTIAVCPRCHLLVRCYDDAGATTSRVRQVAFYILPHPCGNQRDLNSSKDPHIEPMVNNIRARLDCIEARLPQKRLLVIRPKRSASTSKSDALDSLMDHLEVVNLTP